MKNILLVQIFLLCLVHPAQAQTNSADPGKIYHTWVIPVKKSRVSPWGTPAEKGGIRPWGPPPKSSPVTKGFLYEVKDSSLLIDDSFSEKRHYMDESVLTQVDARSIDVIKLRKKGNQGTGILIGAVSGLLAAGAVDLIIYSNWQKAEGSNSLEKDLNYMFVQAPQFIAVIASTLGLLGTGIGIGAAVGSASIKIPIKGSQKLFDKNKYRLNDYAMKYNPDLGSKSFSRLRDTVADIDGNIYHTVALGGQVWMAENLKVKHFRDGTEISGVTINTSGSGNQYDWYAASPAKNICPAGWHVPSLAEWTSFFNSLGGSEGAGHKMEEGFSPNDKVCQWWTSTEAVPGKAKSLDLNNASAGAMFASTSKKNGLSIRCIRDF
jgi:hypothetical protein